MNRAETNLNADYSLFLESKKHGQRFLTISQFASRTTFVKAKPRVRRVARIQTGSNSAWSTSLIGFASTAYTNVVWMIGLGLLGKKFYFLEGLRYRPAFYVVPAIVFICLHVTHTVMYYQRTHGK